MKLKLPLSLLFLGSLIWMFSLQSCTQSGTSDTTDTEGTVSTEDTTAVAVGTTATATKVKSHGEMNAQEQSDYAAKHAEVFTFIDEKVTEISNETVTKKDQYNFECGNGIISLERHYNENGEIHLLTYTICKDSSNCSTKHHFFWEDKLVYQFFHHTVQDGDKEMVDDHKTFFKDGKMIQCLEKRYTYVKGEGQPNTPYQQVDCVTADKLTSDIEQLLTLSVEEAKAYLCR